MAKFANAKLLKIIEKGNMKELQKYLDTQLVSGTIIEILDTKEKCFEKFKIDLQTFS